MEKNTSVIKPCTCNSSAAATYQDHACGSMNRVHTPINKNRGDKSGGNQDRCTVCGNEKP